MRPLIDLEALAVVRADEQLAVLDPHEPAGGRHRVGGARLDPPRADSRVLRRLEPVRLCIGCARRSVRGLRYCRPCRLRMDRGLPPADGLDLTGGDLERMRRAVSRLAPTGPVPAHVHRAPRRTS